MNFIFIFPSPLLTPLNMTFTIYWNMVQICLHLKAPIFIFKVYSFFKAPKNQKKKVCGMGQLNVDVIPSKRTKDNHNPWSQTWFSYFKLLFFRKGRSSCILLLLFSSLVQFVFTSFWYHLKKYRELKNNLFSFINYLANLNMLQ